MSTRVLVVILFVVSDTTSHLQSLGPPIPITFQHRQWQLEEHLHTVDVCSQSQNFVQNIVNSVASYYKHLHIPDKQS